MKKSKFLTRVTSGIVMVTLVLAFAGCKSKVNPDVDITPTPSGVKVTPVAAQAGKVTTTVNVEGTKVTIDPTDAKVGEEITVTVADAANGYAFVGWVEDGKVVSTDKAYKFKATDKARNLAALFAPKDLKTNGAEVVGAADGVTEVVIPSGLKVADFAFYNNANITRVVFEEGTTAIGVGSFVNCYALTRVVLPKSIEKIGAFAFDGCTELEAVDFGAVKEIGDFAFEGCSSLKEVVLPETLTKLGSAAFYCCDGLESVVLPKSLKAIEEGTFAGCSELKQVSFPDSITSVGENAFFNCSNLQEVEFTGKIGTISGGAFYGASSLQEVSIPGSVGKIGDFTFNGCKKLVTFKFGGTVTIFANLWSNRCWSDAVSEVQVECTDGIFVAKKDVQ